MGSILKKAKRVFEKNGLLWLLYGFLYKTRLSSFLSDKAWTKMQYRVNVGKKLNLENPQTYNEKLQWLKLYDHNPLYTSLVDKRAVKDYVRCLCGDQFVIPTLAVWDSPDCICLDSLPNRFVLKTNHSGGNTGVVICKDKNSFDFERARKQLKESFRSDPFLISREWPYKNVKKCVFAEKYMEDFSTKELRDYKFFCFNGDPKVLFVASGRQDGIEPCFDFFDLEFNHLDLKCPHPNAPVVPEKPKSFDEMLQLSRQLSKGLPHVRVDLYEVNGKPFFGELTFYHWEGLMPFYPERWNDIFGSWISLPIIYR